VAFTDELATGIVPAGAPELAANFHLGVAAAAGWTLFAFQLLGVLLEPPLLAIARGPRARRLRTLGLVGMAAGLAFAAVAPSYPALLAALALYGPACGLGTCLAQASLAEADPARTEAALARWNLSGLLGDLAAPGALAASVALGLSWRGALAAAALAAGAQALVVGRAPAPGPAAEEDQDEWGATVGEALRAALATPALLGWELAASACTLLDETLVSFGALWLAQRLGAGPAARAAVLTAWTLGGIAGSGLLARAAGRVRPRSLLLAAGLGSAVCYGAWLAAPSVAWSAFTAGAAGLFTAAHYPLLKARAFAALPGRPNVVQAVASAFSAVDLVVPIALGAVADRAGLLAAMLVLLVQPAVVLAAAAATRRAPPPRHARARRRGSPSTGRARTPG
jgi:MFS family permease